MSRIEPRAGRPDYLLLDAGEGRRLERFGSRVVDRPAPMAPGWKSKPDEWHLADLRFDVASGWRGSPESMAPWPVEIADGLTLEVRPTSSGGLGIYPEHAVNLAWLVDQVHDTVARRPDRQASVLNLFAHTGLSTLAAARAGAAVAHVDAARTSVAWARGNAALSGLADRPIRWLVDDALAFVEREARRGRRYDGVVLDPPSFGRAKQGRRSHAWRLEDELPGLLRACRNVTRDDAWVLLTAHTEGVAGDELEGLLRAAFPTPRGGVRTMPLELTSADGRVTLPLGWAVRRSG